MFDPRREGCRVQAELSELHGPFLLQENLRPTKFEVLLRLRDLSEQRTRQLFRDQFLLYHLPNLDSDPYRQTSLLIAQSWGPHGRKAFDLKISRTNCSQ